MSDLDEMGWIPAAMLDPPPDPAGSHRADDAAPVGVRATPSGIYVVRPAHLDRFRRHLLAAALLDTVTRHPNGVVVDLAGLRPDTDLTEALIAALGEIDAWPHPPVFVVGDDTLRTALADRVPTGAADVVPNLPTAEAAVTARPWVASSVTVLRPPLITRALARGLTLEFAQACGLPPRLDAAMLAADELTGRAIHDCGTDIELRLAARDGSLAVAVADEGVRPVPDPRRAEAEAFPLGGVALVEALADACGMAVRPGGGTLLWAVFSWTPEHR